MYYAVIMAGGRGTRLWPKSRISKPKQTLKLFGDTSLFQDAVDRILPLFNYNQVLLITNAEQATILSNQVQNLNPDNIILEPEGRGTAPCIGLAALHLIKRDSDAVMAILTADHLIQEKETFRKALKTAYSLAEKGHLVTLGIKPISPSTGYGYIKQGEKINEKNDFQVYLVSEFTEKPNISTAMKMLESGLYSWNSGMFIWRVDRILEEFQKQMPDLYSGLMEIMDSIDTDEYEHVLHKIWPTIEKQTIDYGIMEGAENVVVLPVDIGWSDIGSWSSLAEIYEKDVDGNTFKTEYICIDTKNTLVIGEDRLVAMIGINNLIIIDTEDALLICSKDSTQKVREIVKEIESKENRFYL